MSAWSQSQAKASSRQDFKEKGMQEIVKCFRYDKWLEISAADLEPGDLFNHERSQVIVSDKPYMMDGKLMIPCQRPEPKPIKVDLSYGILAQVMDMAGTGLAEFDDGTAILADLEWSPGFTYSPRLPRAELETFCQAHLPRYKAFYEAHRAAIDNGDSVMIEPWWNEAFALIV